MVRFCPTPVVRRKCPGLPARLTARLIRYQMPGFRPSWLLTSLTDADAFPVDELVNPYHRRWQIETIFREWKHGLNIQNLRSRTPNGILKEIHAHLLLSNLVRWVMTEATSDTPDLAVDLSFLTALTHVKNAIRSMLRAPPEQIVAIYSLLLTDLRAAKIHKRPGRSYPRPNDGKTKNMGYGKRRLPARLTEA